MAPHEDECLSTFIPPARALSAQQYRHLVTKVYQEKNPSMLGDLAFIFTKYEGREEELFSQVCFKYGADGAELTAGEPSQAELQEDELLDAIIQLEAEVERRSWLVRRKREEAKELVLLISLGQERRRCHGCDLGLCRSQRLVRSAGEVCWAVAEEQRCAAEEAACSPSFQNDALEEDLRRGRQWLLRELRAIILIVVQEDPRFAELAHYLAGEEGLQI
ncbi:PFOR [Symbiodinium natans]|uniref:PFOR protein n=1 Tax=Symbiodinium natans TaxID=878477 RepID=A0A812UL83_9DINO|nr:PFOR [Symbiodinium natans]